MTYRNGNYSAFYVDEPFEENNLRAHSTKDFLFYNLLRAWKGADPAFPFIDSHDKNYNVRDDSDWEKTLKPRIRDRLNNSKNIVLFLSSITKRSRAICEEIDFGINRNCLPVIVVYPEYGNKSDIINCSSKTIKQNIKDLWEKLPVFRDSMSKVPTLHIPMNQSSIKQALENEKFMVNSPKDPGQYFYPC